MAVAVPGQREQPVALATGELGGRQRDMVLTTGVGRPRDVAVREHHRRVAGQALLAAVSAQSSGRAALVDLISAAAVVHDQHRSLLP